MDFDLFIFFVVGIQEALAPTHLATAGVLALGLLFFRKATSSVVAAYILNFLIILLLSGVVFNLGAATTLHALPLFNVFTTGSYFLLGFVFLFVGGVFWRDWLLMSRGQVRNLAQFFACLSVNKGLAGLIGTLVSFWLVVISNTCPAGYHAQWQASMAFLPGRLFSSLSGLFFYEIFRNASTLFVVVFFMMLRFLGTKDLECRKTLVSIILSACYFAMGCVLVYFFYNRF
ncbi:MAG: hypothetical protein WCI27_00740 [Candidatus Omnitrophota bacterium]